MTTKADRLKTLESQARRAQAAFEEAEKKLHRPDGSRLFSDEAHEEEMGRLRSERMEAIGPIEREVFEIRTGAEAERVRAGHFDPMDALTDEELARANARRAFSADAAETLPAEALEERLDAAVTAGDRGALYALYMGAQRRREAIRERQRGSGGNPAGGDVATALDGALERAEAALVGDRGQKAAGEAAGLAEEAVRVELLVSSLRAGAVDAAGAWAARRLARAG